MTRNASGRLSYEEAARTIYGVREPSVLHLAKIDGKLASGRLRGNRRARWVTAESIAAYLAGRAEQQRLGGRRDRPMDRAAGESAAGARDEAVHVLSPLYRDGLRDYFSAVLRRRRHADASPAFRRAVLAGQVILIAFPVAVLLGAWLASTSSPREHAVIENALNRKITEGEIRRYTILDWGPIERDPQSGESRVGVRFRYTSRGGKAIQADHTYLVRGDAALRADDEP